MRVLEYARETGVLSRRGGANREALPETLKIPEEIARREARPRKLEEARRVIEARHRERTAERHRDFEERTGERAARRARGEKVRGPEPPPPGLPGADAMRHRLRTASGRAIYKKRKETVEPFFGIVKAPSEAVRADSGAVAGHGAIPASSPCS